MFSVGDRVEVVSILDDYAPIERGTKGTVDYVNGPVDLGDKPFMQVGVKWDNGRTLMACVPPDVLRRVE